jgi:hypothetical protein
VAELWPPAKPETRRAKVGLKGLQPGIALGWITLTHVCHRWRLILMEEATLWSRILCIFPTAFDIILERARDAPLTIDYILEGRPDIFKSAAARISLIRDHPERLGSVDVHANFDILSFLSGKSYPHLQSLGLKAPYPSAPGFVRFFYGDLKPIIAPNLVHLTMRGCIAPFDAPMLRSLCLVGSLFHGWAITITQALDLLECCPLLEEFITSDAFHADDHIFSEREVCSGRMVQLPRLKSLSITTNGLAFSALWDHISPSKNIAVEIKAFDSMTAGNPSHIPDIFNSIRRLLTTYDTLQVRPSHTRFLSFPGMRLSSSTSEGFCVISIRPFDTWLHELIGMCETVAPFLVQKQIRTLDLSRMSFNTFPRELVSVLRKLRTMSCSFSANSSILDITLFHDGSELLFPDLQTLVQELDYRALEDRDHMVSAAAFEDRWNSIVHFLKERANIGSPLHTLKLVGRKEIMALLNWPTLCMIETKCLGAARKVVTEIVDERVEAKV